jgi:hypothetical protein
MRIEKNILFRLLFATMILFCLGLEVMNYAAYNTPSTEMAANQNTEDIHSQSDMDLFDDDHINQNFDHIQFSDQLIHLSFGLIPTHFSEFIEPGWQPPQLS